MKNKASEKIIISRIYDAVDKLQLATDNLAAKIAKKQKMDWLEDTQRFNDVRTDLVNLKNSIKNSTLLEPRDGTPVADTESGLHLTGVNASFSNKYGFLYWCENDITADDCRYKWIEASTLDEACEKFLKKAPKTLRQVDYEVQLGNKYIDISERADFQNWL